MAKKKALTAKEKAEKSIKDNLVKMDIVDRFKFGNAIKQGKIPQVFMDEILSNLK